MKVYYDQDADLSVLKNKTVAIIGYGSQGHAHAQNLRDSGVKVVVGQRPGGANYELAKQHGFTPVSAAEAAAQGDLIMILLPDEVQAAVYEKDIKPHLTKGKALLFAHGFNIHFNQIVPPKDVDVFLIAPKGPGHLVRRTFTEGGGVPCLVGIQQDATGEALKVALAYAKGIGGTRSSRSAYVHLLPLSSPLQIMPSCSARAIKRVIRWLSAKIPERLKCSAISCFVRLFFPHRIFSNS